MQGLRSTSALFWAPEKVGVRQPLLIFFHFVGDPRECRDYVAIPPSSRPPGKVGVASSNFVHALGVGDPRECIGYVAIPPSSRPLRSQG